MNAKPARFFYPLLCLLLLALMPRAGAFENPALVSGWEETRQAVIYHRLQDTAYLVKDDKLLRYSPKTGYETALMQAVVDDPAPGNALFTPLFPRGTTVLNATMQNGLLFVTLSHHARQMFAGDPPADMLTNQESKPALRRRLSMDALVNTATENLNCHSVQVLIDAPDIQSSSLRLDWGYYFEQKDGIPPPLKRNESVILTPGHAVSLFFQAWQTMDKPLMQTLLPQDRPSSALPALLGATHSQGTLSRHGQEAIVLVTVSLQHAQEPARAVTDFPLHLKQNGPLWTISPASFDLMLKGADHAP